MENKKRRKRAGIQMKKFITYTCFFLFLYIFPILQGSHPVFFLEYVLKIRLTGKAQIAADFA